MSKIEKDTQHFRDKTGLVDLYRISRMCLCCFHVYNLLSTSGSWQI